MSDYTVTFDGAGKDALSSGNAAKVAKGADLDVEFDAIAIAVNSKYDSGDALLADIDGMTQDPGADRILFWDNSASPAATTEWLTVTNGLEISTTNLGIADSAGGAGLAISSGVLSLDFNELSAETSHASGDSLMMIDATDNGSQKITIDNFLTGVAGNGLSASTNTLALDLNELTTDTAVGAAEFVVVYTDGSKKISLSNFALAIDSVLSLSNIGGYVADQHVAHSGVSVITASRGLSASNNDLSSNIGLELDITSCTNIEADALAVTDEFVVDQSGVPKAIQYQKMGRKVQAGETTQTLAAADANTILEFDGAATVTVPADATHTWPPGASCLLCVDHATSVVTVTVTSTAVLNSVYHPGGATTASDTVVSGGTAALIYLGSDQWYLVGDIGD